MRRPVFDMNELSRNGVCYEVERSPYVLTVGAVTYYFSSAVHLRKFAQQFKAHREEINVKARKRFRVTCDFSAAADLLLYSEIESRGFFVKIGGDGFSCLQNLVMSLVLPSSGSLPAR